MDRQNWTPEQLDAFREEVAAGGNTRAIAARLTLRLGMTVTKNSVIGRCNRMGIKSPTPGGRIYSEPTRAQDEALLRILRLHSQGLRPTQIGRRINSRLTADEIRRRILAVFRDEAEAEGWSNIGSQQVVA